MFVKTIGEKPRKRTVINGMGIILRCLSVWLIAAAGVFSLSARDINATIKVRSDAVHGSNKQLFTSLEEALSSFINGRRWSDLSGEPSETIHCNFTLLVTEALSDRSFRGELYVQARRPAGSVSRETPMLNIRDQQIEFNYAAYQPLSFDPHFVEDNLTATVAFYVYLVLGLTADADVLMSGTPFFRAMEQIAAAAQPYGWRGWERERSSRSRAVVAATFNDGSAEDFRKMWFRYHASGIDLLSANPADGRENMVSAVALIASLQEEQPGSVLISLFGDAKLEELTLLLSNGNRVEKRQAYQTLRKIYPTRGTLLDTLREN